MSLSAVMIDSRESDAIKALKFGGIPVIVTTLEHGDLWASTDDGALLVIERKAPNDLLNSIKDGRLLQQCAALPQRSKWAYLMITGALAHTLDGHVVTDNRTTGWRWEAVQGALLSVQELGVNVVYCQSDSHYEETVSQLARRDRSPEKALTPRTSGRVLSPAEQILTSLPGIGLERAQALLREFDGHVGHALSWLTWTDTMVEIANIGNGTKNNVRRALALKPEEWLTVFHPEAAEYAAKHMANNAEPTRTAIMGV